MPEFDVDEVRTIIDELYPPGPEWQTRPRSEIIDRFEASNLPWTSLNVVREMPDGEYTRSDLMTHLTHDLDAETRRRLTTATLSPTRS